MIKSYDELTPVQNIGGLFIKRDDLYIPFGNRSVNGGKLRQCYMLIDSIKDKGYEGVISCCSIHSPQAPITAAVAKHFNIPCIIYYGATTKKNLLKASMPRIVINYGGKIQIASKSGIHNILYQKARKFAKENNYFVVDYGFNIADHADLLFSAISSQVENIPDNLDNLVITCGSGITSIGVLLGINHYNKNVKKIHLVATAPDRREFIHSTLEKYNADRHFEYHDLFHLKGFKYEDECNVSFKGIDFHPNYEGKTFAWLKGNIEYEKQSTLLWSVGRKPKL